jgi:tartrate-resistant acid phosphatase type 5
MKKVSRFTKLFLILFFSLYSAAALSAAPGLKATGQTGKKLQFIAVGDVGHNKEGQKLVAQAMAQKASQDPVQLVLLLGDNFSAFGVDSIEDPQWDSRFEKAYAYPSLNVPFYAVLGNHDRYGNYLAEVFYTARSSRWKMPEVYYDFTAKTDGSAKVQFFALDTSYILSGNLDNESQIEWLEKKLKRSKARWKIVFSHDPVFSGGAQHGNSKALIPLLEPLFKKYRVDLYISGHDHHQELIRSDYGTWYVICGSGSSKRSATNGQNTLYSSSELGFGWFSVSKDELDIQFISASGDVKYRQKIKKAEKAR